VRRQVKEANHKEGAGGHTALSTHTHRRAEKEVGEELEGVEVALRISFARPWVRGRNPRALRASGPAGWRR
jgi:hypothetical protein